jgi:hypothetical protein
VPFVLVAATLGPLWLPASRRPGAPPLDFPGVAPPTLALTGIVFALIEGAGRGLDEPGHDLRRGGGHRRRHDGYALQAQPGKSQGRPPKQARARDRTAGPGQTSQERVSCPETRVGGRWFSSLVAAALWRSSAGADGAPIVEEKHSRPASCLAARCARRMAGALVGVGLPLEQLGDFERVSGLDQRLPQQLVGGWIAAPAHRGNGAVDVVVRAPVLDVGAEQQPVRARAALVRGGIGVRRGRWRA